MPTRCNRGFLFADLIACLTCFGHHYVHLQELKRIIQWLLPVVFRAVVFKLLVWCGAEGYVSGLQEAAWNNSSLFARIAIKVDIWEFFENLSRKFQFHYNTTRITDTLHEDLRTYKVGQK